MDILLNSECGFWCTVTHYTKYGSIVEPNVVNQNVIIRSSQGIPKWKRKELLLPKLGTFILQQLNHIPFITMDPGNRTQHCCKQSSVILEGMRGFKGIVLRSSSKFYQSAFSNGMGINQSVSTNSSDFAIYTYKTHIWTGQVIF